MIRHARLPVLLSILMAAPAVASAQEPKVKHAVGNYVVGIYGDQDRPIVYVTVLVQGKFDAKTANQLWAKIEKQQYDNAAKGGDHVKTHDLSRITTKTGGDFYVISGWVNTAQKQTGWVAVQNLSDTSAHWMFRDTNGKMKQGASDDWVDNRWQTEGFHVLIGATDDDNGNIVLEFKQP